MANESPVLKLEELDGFMRRFLETSPLYRGQRFRCESGPGTFEWPRSLTYECRKCRQPTTWVRTDDNEFTVVFRMSALDTRWLKFVCVLCRGGDTAIAFWVDRASVKGQKHWEFTLRKYGQLPAWSITIPDKVRSALPDNVAGFYQNGVICMSQKFGLAAAAYFRRVVEEVTGHLMDLVEESARVLGDQAALDVVAAARTSRQGSDKLAAIASVVPSSLRINGGQNPLTSLYDAYSESIHAKTEDECMEIALRCQAILNFVLPGLHEQLTGAREFKAAMESLPPPRPRAPRPQTNVAPADAAKSRSPDSATNTVKTSSK